MSSAASIALLILAVEAIVLLLALVVGAIVAGISVLESTALLRSLLRRQAKGARRVEDRITGVIENELLPRLVQVERAATWATTFFRAISKRR